MVEKIFNSDVLSNLDNISQWSEKNRLHNETVSSHSLKVSILCRALLDDIFGTTDQGINRFKLDCVTHALFHDVEESFLQRDISHELKYNRFNGEDIREALDAFSTDAAAEFCELRADQPSEAGFAMFQAIKQPQSVVKKVVKLCDWLAMLYNLRIETQLGNQGEWVSRISLYCKESISKVAQDVKDSLLEAFGDDHGIATNELDMFINGDY